MVTYYYLVLVEEHAKLLDTDTKISFVELIWNIPS